MITDIEIERRLAEYDEQLTQIALEFAGLWNTEYDAALNDRNHEDYRETVQMFEYDQSEMKRLERDYIRIKDKEQVLLWVMGKIPGYDLIPEEVSVWVSSTQNREALQKYQQENWNQEPTHRPEREIERKQREQVNYLIEKCLDKLSNLHYSPTEQFLRELMTRPEVTLLNIRQPLTL